MEPFRYRRRVGFGECDPARIFFAPRAFDYAVEAVEAWFEAALGTSWATLVSRDGREARVLAAECEYERPLVEGDEIDVVVEVVGVGLDTFTTSAVATPSRGGEPSFRALVTLAVFERGGLSPRPLPPEARSRLGAVAAASAPAGRRAHRDRTPPAVVGRAASESAATFTRRRRVRYGDCTAAGDAYAPRVVEWAVEAVGEWYAAQLGVSWLEQCVRGRGTPFLGIRCELPRRLEAGTELTLAVSIPRLGSSSIGYAVVGRDARGEPCFHAEMSACYITEEGGRRSTPFPGPLRERILAYQAATGGAAPPRS